jgi:hypothetical protein
MQTAELALAKHYARQTPSLPEYLDGCMESVIFPGN